MGRRDQVQFLHVAGAGAKKALDTASISHYNWRKRALTKWVKNFFKFNQKIA
jgi:hypothetical protein